MEQRQGGVRCGLDHLPGPLEALLVVVGDVDDASDTGLPQGAVALQDLSSSVGVAGLGGGQKAGGDHQIGTLLSLQFDQPAAGRLQQGRPLVHGPGIGAGAALPTLVAAVVGVKDLAAGAIETADALGRGIGVGAAGGQGRMVAIEHHQPHGGQLRGAMPGGWMPTGRWSRCRPRHPRLQQAQVGLDAAGGSRKIPAGQAQQQVHAVAATAAALPAAALVAEPAAGTVIAVPAVAIGAAAGGAGLVPVLQLLRAQAAQLDQQPRPLTGCGLHQITGHQQR